MKIQCKRQELVEAVSNVQRAVSSKSSVPALEGILIKTSQQGIQLCGYDLELGITTGINATTEENGDIILPARLFGDIVRRLPDDRVSIQADEKCVTTIKSGDAEFSIVGIPASEYPELPSINGSSSISLPQVVLKSMIRQTIFAVAESDAKPIHTGTLFEIKENRIRLVSVDGYRLAMRSERVQSEEEFSFVVPGKTLSEVLKLLSDEDKNVTISVGSRHIIFGIENYSVLSRLLEGDFLDYNAAIPTSHATEISVQTRSFIDSVERVSLLITDRLKSPVRSIFDRNEIKLSCSTAMGKASDQFAAQISGDSVEMGFNNRYLLDALRNTEGDEIKIQLNGPLSPMKVLPKNGDAFLFLVLPVRLKNEE